MTSPFGRGPRRWGRSSWGLGVGEGLGVGGTILGYSEGAGVAGLRGVVEGGDADAGVADLEVVGRFGRLRAPKSSEEPPGIARAQSG